MHSVIEQVDRPDQETVAAFEGIPSAIISDVSAGSGVTMDSGISPIATGSEIAAPAVTISAAPGDNLVIHKAITMADPGDVLVVDGNGYTETAFIGELMCASCLAHDLAGIVVDGAVRDRAELADMPFPVFARGVHPAGPGKHAPGSINIPVTCGGVTVSPGDIIVGDEDGIAVVPAQNAAATLERARQKDAREDELRERVDAGEYLYDIGGYDDKFDALELE
ncbi:MAG: RraA family protein [Salinirussus sp.]